jgi:hypothetical protein
VTLAGFLALIAPSGGSSGLPKEPAFAADTVIAAPMADAANRSRLENMVVLLRIDSSESSSLARVGDLLPRRARAISAADQYCLAFDILSLNSSLFSDRCIGCAGGREHSDIPLPDLAGLADILRSRRLEDDEDLQFQGAASIDMVPPIARGHWLSHATAVWFPRGKSRRSTA